MRRAGARPLAAALAGLVAAGAAGCGGALGRRLEPLEGYRQARSDAPPFEEARAVCEREAAFRTANGTAFTDWEQFERCMNQRGWTRTAAGPAEENYR
jgi:hypothetical protein